MNYFVRALNPTAQAPPNRVGLPPQPRPEKGLTMKHVFAVARPLFGGVVRRLHFYYWSLCPGYVIRIPYMSLH